MKNKVTAHDYFLRFCELSLACFKWENLPETCDARYIELSLLETGRAVFFKEPNTGDIMSLRFTPDSQYDVYGNPTRINIYGYNGYQQIMDARKCAPIYNNMLRNNFTLDLIRYSNMLYDIDMSIMVNAKAQKTPVLLICDEPQLMTIRNLYRKYEGNEPVIYGTKSLKDAQISSIRTDAPFMADRLWNLKSNIWNEALTYLGIANVSIEKRERLITDEVNRTQGGVMVNRQIRLQQRELACEKANELFGTNIKVSFNDENIDLPENYMEGDEDE